MPAEKLVADPKNRVKAMTLHAGSNMATNPSSQALLAKSDPLEVAFCSKNASRSTFDDVDELKVSTITPNHVTRGQWVTIAILTFVNLINYMDRYTIAGILDEVQDHFRISNAQAGLLQTAFVASFMVFAPLFGFLGDRYSRKWVMVAGVTTWAVATLLGSFADDFWTFVAMRAVVGIGEASYTTIAPTILSDLFVKEMRSKALAIFYFAIPVGSGLGYVFGKALAGAFGEWQWALRGTPVLGVAAVIAIAVFLVDPPRGESEGHDRLKATSYAEDLRSLAANGSFVYSTLGFTCVTFCTGALSWWGPKFLADALKSANVRPDRLTMDPKSVAFVFGIVTMMSGVIGVPIGSLMSTKLRPKYERVDPLICAFGLAVSSVFLCLAIFLCNVSFFLAFILIFIGEVSLNLNWSIVADILLYVVVPTRRGSAEAFQILFSHLFGDAGSPYLIGIIADSLKNGTVTEEVVCLDAGETEILAADAAALCDDTRNFYSMQYSLVINILVVFLGAVAFFLCAVYIARDKRRADRYVADGGDNKNNSEERFGMVNSENNSTWSDDDAPPQLVVVPALSQHGKIIIADNNVEA